MCCFPMELDIRGFLQRRESGSRYEELKGGLRVLTSADLGVYFLKRSWGCFFCGVRGCKIGADCGKGCLFNCGVRGLFSCEARSYKCQFGAKCGVSGYS